MKGVGKLLDLMKRLRDPETGCPWDCKQEFHTIAPYTLEEAYEVVDAIDREDHQGLCEELGDLLLQVVYHSQIANEKKLFDFDDVVNSIVDKMIRRHPHVFGDLESGDDAELAQRWERDKEKTRGKQGHHGVFDGIARNLPALRLADKLQNRAASKGFDWEESSGVLEKLDEEVCELRDAIDKNGADKNNDVAEEIGDLLFTIVNLSRHFSIDAEDALRRSGRKFTRRVGLIEEKLRIRKRDWRHIAPEELNDLWEQVKAEENQGENP